MRIGGLAILAFLAGWTLATIFLVACGEDLVDAAIPVTTWRIERHVDPDHPLIQAWARDVRAMTSNPKEQAAVAESAVWHLVRYWNSGDQRGRDNVVPSVDEIVARSVDRHWETLRGNCVSQSIMLCSLLRALGLHAWVNASAVHAWVEFEVEGQTYRTLLPELSLSRTGDLPLKAKGSEGIQAALRLGGNLDGGFDEIGLLPDANPPKDYFEHPEWLLVLLPVLLGWVQILRIWDRETLDEFGPRGPRTWSTSRTWPASEVVLGRSLWRPRRALRAAV